MSVGVVGASSSSGPVATQDSIPLSELDPKKDDFFKELWRRVYSDDFDWEENQETVFHLLDQFLENKEFQLFEIPEEVPPSEELDYIFRAIELKKSGEEIAWYHLSQYMHPNGFRGLKLVAEGFNYSDREIGNLHEYFFENISRAETEQGLEKNLWFFQNCNLPHHRVAEFDKGQEGKIRDLLGQKQLPKAQKLDQLLVSQGYAKSREMRQINPGEVKDKNRKLLLLAGGVLLLTFAGWALWRWKAKSQKMGRPGMNQLFKEKVSGEG